MPAISEQIALQEPKKSLTAAVGVEGSGSLRNCPIRSAGREPDDHRDGDSDQKDRLDLASESRAGCSI